MLIEPDGSVRIAWEADGCEAIHVLARFREQEELEEWARGVADLALFERTTTGLRRALVAAWPGAFSFSVRRAAQGPGRVVVSFHPPQRAGRPDLV